MKTKPNDNLNPSNAHNSPDYDNEHLKFSFVRSSSSPDIDYEKSIITLSLTYKDLESLRFILDIYVMDIGDKNEDTQDSIDNSQDILEKQQFESNIKSYCDLREKIYSLQRKICDTEKEFHAKHAFEFYQNRLFEESLLDKYHEGLNSHFIDETIIKDDNRDADEALLKEARYTVAKYRAEQQTFMEDNLGFPF